jgi:uncharacterized membrane protein
MEITHIHPMVVHFPIVLFLLSLALYAFMLVTGRDMAARNCLTYVAATMLVLGVVSAAVAAFFGDIALDAAVDKGFSKAHLEEHEDLAGTTIAIFSLVALVLLGAMWKKIQISGAKGLVFLIAVLAGTSMLVITAYHGGELVYKDGVNVDAVKPAPGTSMHNTMQEDDD